jgi:hypothetical protein
MANEKPKRLFYLGGITRAPDEGLPGIPARDLDEADIANLSEEQIEEALTEPPFAEGSPYRGALYQVSQPTRGGKPVTPAATRTTEPASGVPDAEQPKE